MNQSRQQRRAEERKKLKVFAKLENESVKMDGSSVCAEDAQIMINGITKMLVLETGLLNSVREQLARSPVKQREMILKERRLSTFVDMLNRRFIYFSRSLAEGDEGE